jgi:HK97 family phage portal protein
VSVLRRGRERREITVPEALQRAGITRSNRQSLDVTYNEAATLSAVWASVSLYARTISSLPVAVGREQDGQFVAMTNKPQLFAAPSVGQSWLDWCHAAVWSLVMAGNVYGFVSEADSNGLPRRIDLLDPMSVSWMQGSDKRWVLRVEGQQYRRWPLGPIWHVPMHTVAGYPFGLNPIAHFRTMIAGGIKAEEFAARFFADSAIPPAVLAPERDPGEEGAKKLKAAFMSAMSGNREPVVLPQSVKYERISVDPEDSQFLESQRFTVEQVARVFGLAPEMIGGASSGSSVTYANREQRMADFLALSLGPLLAKLEQALSELLPRPQFVKFRTGGLLRADLQGRYTSYLTAAQVSQAMGRPLLTVDEMRALEDLAPLDDDEDDAELPDVAPADD